MDRSMILFDLVDFLEVWHPPDLLVVNVIADRPGCIAARINWDYSGTFVDASPATDVEVVELSGGEWGFSFAGEGWACEGPHPLSG